MLSPIVAPTVVAVNPPADSVAALPLAMLSVTFDQDMFVGAASDTSSVTDPADYVLVGAVTGRAAVQSVQYNPATRTALLTVFGLAGDDYTLTVGTSIVSANRVPLAAPYVTHFTATSNLAAYVQVSFSNARSDRADGTVSYDVTIQNTAQFSLFLPLFFVLDPAQGFAGIPAERQPRIQRQWLIDLTGKIPDGTELKPGQTTTGQTLTISDPNQLKVTLHARRVGHCPTASTPVFDSTPVTTVTAGACCTATRPRPTIRTARPRASCSTAGRPG